MDESKLIADVAETLSALVDRSPGNTIDSETALEPNMTGVRLFDAPIIGVASACDELFVTLRNPAVIGPRIRLPHEWLDSAQSVITYFFPISEFIRKSNRESGHASPGWLHARIDGQKFILEAGKSVVALLEEQGFEAVCPAAQPEIEVIFLNQDDPAASFFCNWPERHVAFIGGLGTFSLNKGLITERGMAGRLGSVITSAKIPATTRAYTRYDEYCTRCGTCIGRCPVGAISLESGKDHYRCFEEMIASKKLYEGYIGCGKCQTRVPCEFSIPK